VGRAGEAAGKQELVGPQAGCRNPGADRLSGLLRQLEPDWLTGLALNHRRSGEDTTGAGDIPDAEVHEITSAQLAVDGEIEQGEIPNPLGDLQPDADGPGLLEFERRFRSDQPALFQDLGRLTVCCVCSACTIWSPWLFRSHESARPRQRSIYDPQPPFGSGTISAALWRGADITDALHPGPAARRPL
jgi:hypothetical protein